MPYSATTYRLLLATPSDIPDDDRSAVFRAVNRWNAIYGKDYGATIMPTHWKDHSAAEHGQRPQKSLNKQLVQDADILIALFWHRLGSDTGEAESGTVEEIEEGASHGAYVAILRCTRDIPTEQLDLDQMAKLEAFLERIRPDSLVLEYEDPQELRERVENILTRAVTESSAAAQAEAATEAPATSAEPPAQVWPRVERRESPKTNSRGRIKTDRRWYLVLSNTGREPAKQVEYRLEVEEGVEGEVPMEPGERRPLEVLAPGTDTEYGLFMHSGVVDQARCVVTWQDSAGEHENTATLRFF
jgi:hypothetical protein